MYRFAYPSLLFLILIIIGFVVYAFKKKSAAITYSAASELKAFIGNKGPDFIIHIPVFLRVIALVLIVVAIARPQKYNISSDVKTSGIDIILCVDTSGSMRALDFFVDDKRVNRLEAVKSVIREFIRKRENDRIGIVIFGEKAFTQCPLTMDKGLLINLVDGMKIGMAGDRTAIGLALALGSKRLKDIEAKSKILILLTDGRNNAGDIDPSQSAEAAATIGVKIYSIGVGGFGEAPFVVDTVFGKRLVNRKVDLDEGTLKTIAKIGDGRYFRASDSKKLKEIYDIIDKLEKTEIKVKKFFNYKELYRYFLFPALLILLLEIILRGLILRSVP